MAIEVYYSYSLNRYLTFYAGETSDGCFAANYKDSSTMHTLEETFLGTLKGISKTLKGSAVQGECIVDVTGVDTKLGYFMRGGHHCISTFKGDDNWFGYGKSNQANSLGLQLYAMGLRQTKENVCSFLKLVPEQYVKTEKVSSYEEYLSLLDNAERKKYEDRKSFEGRFIEYPKTTAKEFENELNNAQLIKAGNLQRIQDGINKGDIVFPYIKNGQPYINKTFYEAMLARGLEMEKLPQEIAFNVGFALRGVNFKTVSGKDYKAHGVLFRLDDLGNGTPYQIRCMKPVQGENRKFEYVTKQSGADLRYYNTGAATTFGLFHALSDEKRRPVVVTEGVFDALSVYAGGEDRLNAVALQGCGNQQYFLEHAKEFKEKGIPIILALDEDRAGINGRNRLIEGLQKEKVDFTVFPGTLGYGDLNDLLRSDMKNGRESTERGHKAEKLLLLTSEVVFLARERKYTPRKLERIIEGISQGRVKGDVGKNGTQIGAATLILNKVKEEGLFLLEQFKDKTEDEKDKIREAFLTTCLEAIHTAGGVQQERTPEISQNINKYRPVFYVNDENKWDREMVGFEMVTGQDSAKAKTESALNLANAFKSEHEGAEVLEISTKSTEELGRRLSAFNLKDEYMGKFVPIENIFQGCKISENHGPFPEVLNMKPWEAKKYVREQLKGERIIGFKYNDFTFLSEKFPKTFFYDKLYINALLNPKNKELTDKLLNSNYKGFTDIEFDPERAINCQAQSVAIIKSLYASGKLDALKEKASSKDFINVVYKELKAQPEESEKIQNKGANPKESWQRDTDR